MARLVMPIVTALGVMLLSGPFAAADKPWERGVPEASKERARKLTSEGVRHAADSRWPQAAAKFKEALGHWDHPRIHYNLIEPLVMLDKPLEANRHLARALAYGRQGLGPEKYREALVQQKQLAGRIATLTIECELAGAEVSLDGKKLFTAPGRHTGTLAPGTHVVVAKKPGFFPTTRALVLIGGSARLETVTLVKVSAGKTIYARRFSTWLPWAFAGSGALVGAVGLGLRALARSSFDQYDTLIRASCEPSCPLTAVQPYEHLKARGQLYDALAIGGFVVAGGLIVTGLTMAILNSPRAVGIERPGTPGARSTRTITPAISPAGPGVQVSWAFSAF